MDTMDRRTFMAHAAQAVGAGLVVPLTASAAEVAATQPTAATGCTATRPANSVLRASDTLTLTKARIQTSRLAIGTGTQSNGQSKLGEKAFIKLLRHGLDQGIRWWDTAEMYQIHPLVRPALKEIPRDKVVITSKSMARSAQEMREALERCRQTVGTDYIDIFLVHCMVDADWPTKMRGQMDVLSEAKSKGWVRAVGCSCHSLEALEAAAKEPWVDVTLARFNPYAVNMDVGSEGEVPKIVEVLRTMQANGKSIYGMKILGEGKLQGDRIDSSLKFALTHPFINGFVIGFKTPEEIDDIAARIERLRVPAVG